MSGHSHFSTIKRQKAANDALKGRVFSRHSKSIAIAIKEGGSADPEMNSKLRFAIERAKSDNMPKSNIDRILQRASEVGNIEEITYEGFGPYGVGIVVRTATDNKNRTSQEIKNIFERGGGSMAGPGSVLFNFEQKGLIIIKKQKDSQTQILSLIDLGVEDVEEAEDAIEAYVAPAKLSEVRKAVLDAGYEITSFSLILKPKNFVMVDDPNKAKKVLGLIDLLEEHDDVQDVYTNIDMPLDVAKSLRS
jgi:YebC/PmpR family DNA-binding regulatory protein